MSSTHEDKLWPVATALGACSICATYGGPGVRALALRSCRIFPDLSLLNMSRRPAVVLWDASRREELAAHARQVDVSQCKAPSSSFVAGSLPAAGEHYRRRAAASCTGEFGMRSPFATRQPAGRNARWHGAVVEKLPVLSPDTPISSTRPPPVSWGCVAAAAMGRLRFITFPLGNSKRRISVPEIAGLATRVPLAVGVPFQQRIATSYLTSRQAPGT